MSDRPDRRAAGLPTAAPISPMSEIGSPSQQQDAEEVVAEALDPHLDQPRGTDGEVARQGRRVVPGEDVEAGDRQGVGQGLAGERAAERGPVADRPGQEDEAARRRRPWRRAGPASPGRGRRMPQATMSQASAEEDRLVAGQRGKADEDAQPDDPRVGQAGAARIGGDAGHEQARRQGEDRERHRRVGQRRVEEERQVDRGGQPGPDRERPGAAGGKPAFRRDVGGEPPGQDRHDRPDDDGRPLGGRERRARGEPSGSRPGSVGSGSQTSNAWRGNSSGGVP